MMIDRTNMSANSQTEDHMRIQNATSHRTQELPKNPCLKYIGYLASGLQKIYSVFTVDVFWGDPLTKGGYQKWKSGREIFVINLPDAEQDKGLVGFLLEQKTNGIAVYDLIEGRDGLMQFDQNKRPDLRAKYIVQDVRAYFRKGE